MERINYNSLKFLEYVDNLNPQNSGIFFSVFLHLIILLFAVGIPNFFGPKDIFVPNVIPIEILNVSETTNIEKNNNKSEENKNTATKQKKFNASENTEIQKVELKQKVNSVNVENEPTIKIKEKSNITINEKKLIEVQEKENIEIKTKVETIKTDKIKPKLKPKPKKIEPKTNTDIQIEPKVKEEIKSVKKNDITAPKQKPEQDFNQMLASSLRDLRNEKTNNVQSEELEKVNDNKQSSLDEMNENSTLSISEIDLLIQQLSSCWVAPAGAVIPDNTIIKISATLSRNMEVLSNSIRIIDTNLSKSNPFYGPITDSAKRTLLNPECTPLKLPKEKYDLWKNLTIRFDHDIMKGN